MYEQVFVIITWKNSYTQHRKEYFFVSMEEQRTKKSLGTLKGTPKRMKVPI